MKAICCPRYGSPEVLTPCELPTPVPGSGEVLIRLHASTVSRSDDGILHARPWFMRLAFGLVRPKTPVLGMDLAGVVEATGDAVTRFRPGDRVFGLSPDRYGAHAEYIALPETAPLAILPDGIAFHEAVLCEGAWYAETYLEAVGLGPGQNILIYGASGAIGTAAVQLAKARGAHVTAVAGPEHQTLIRDLGADRRVDYTAEDFTAIGETFDMVFDAVGKSGYFACRRLLKPGGTFSATDLGAWGHVVLGAFLCRILGSRRILFPFPVASPALVDRFAGLMRSGALRAVIDRRYPLADVPEAFRYVETETKTGIVVVDIPGG